MSIERVVVLHGYTASPTDHWFDWLGAQLAPHGLVTHVPALPDSQNPKAAAWTDAAVAVIGTPSPSTVVVGHSLGTITAIRALGDAFTAHPDTRLGGLVLIAPFVTPVAGLSELDPFTVGLPELGELAARIDRRLVMHSDADPIVPPVLAAPIAVQLDAELIEVAGGGHFMGSEGWTTLPPLLDWLRG